MYNGSNVLIFDKVVSRNDYQSVFESNLHIKALNKMDSANYTCRSQNIVGSNQADGKLIVQCKYILNNLIIIIFIACKGGVSIRLKTMGDGMARDYSCAS